MKILGVISWSLSGIIAFMAVFYTAFMLVMSFLNKILCNLELYQYLFIGDIIAAIVSIGLYRLGKWADAKPL